jgi:hypothetical protein
MTKHIVTYRFIFYKHDETLNSTIQTCSMCLKLLVFWDETPWRRKPEVPKKNWYLIPKLHAVISQKSVISIFTAWEHLSPYSLPENIISIFTAWEHYLHIHRLGTLFPYSPPGNIISIFTAWEHNLHIHCLGTLSPYSLPRNLISIFTAWEPNLHIHHLGT